MDDLTDHEIISEVVIPKTIEFVCGALNIDEPHPCNLFDLLKGGDDDESDESVGLQSESDRGEGRE
jgi:hypothetical protein